MTPTEWLEANKEEFRDLQIELKKRKFSQTKAKDMMMGMAISLCMERKGYWNKCIADSDSEDTDLQVMQTAPLYSCWSKNKRTTNENDKEGASAPSAAPSQSQTVIINNQPPSVIIQPAPPPQPVIVEPPPKPALDLVYRGPETPFVPPQSPTPSLPHMSTDDLAQFNEVMSIISQPVRIIGDDEGGAKEARFASCYDYWRRLHYNRSQDARQVLYAVRVARCMYRTNYAVMRTRAGCQWELSGQLGWQQATNILLSSRCYGRF
jgi:hypothetical protein